MTYRADTAALRLIQALLSLLAAVLTAAAFLYLSPFPILMWILIAIFAGIGVIVGFLILPLMFRNFRCEVTATQVAIRSGIFLMQEQSIRINTIQFVQIISGPFDGILGLNFIILHVYGGQLALLFLRKDDRKALTAFLRQKGVFYAP